MESKVRRFIKYQNRKIYDKDNGTYTTMETLISVVHGGADIEVVDDRTGEDVTVKILARVLYDMSRVNNNSFSGAELCRIIRKAPAPGARLKRPRKAKRLAEVDGGRGTGDGKAA